MRIILLFIILGTCVFSETTPKGIYIDDNFFKKTNKVAITIDDGITPSTPKNLDTLKKWNSEHPSNIVHATFFFVSDSLEDNTRITQRVIEEGHYFGNHTRFHTDLHHMDIEKVRGYISRSNEDYINYCNYTIKYFRPPYGQRGRGVTVLGESDYVCRDLNMYLIMWNIPIGDVYMYNKTTPRTEEWCFNTTMALVKEYRGGVFLAHDIKKTVPLLPKLLDAMDKMGIKFCTLDDLLEMKYKENNK